MYSLSQAKTLVLIALIAIVAAPTWAADAAPTSEQTAPADKAAEKAAKKAAQKAKQQERLLKKYDKNNNGKIDPEEEALIQADKEKALEKQKKKKEKAAETTPTP